MATVQELMEAAGLLHAGDYPAQHWDEAINALRAAEPKQEGRELWRAT